MLKNRISGSASLVPRLIETVRMATRSVSIVNIKKKKKMSTVLRASGIPPEDYIINTMVNRFVRRPDDNITKRITAISAGIWIVTSNAFRSDRYIDD